MHIYVNTTYIHTYIVLSSTDLLISTLANKFTLTQPYLTLLLPWPMPSLDFVLSACAFSFHGDKLKTNDSCGSNSLTVSPVYTRVFVRNKSQTLSCDGVQFCGWAPCMSSAAPTCPKGVLEPVPMFLKMLSFGLRNSGQSHVPGPGWSFYTTQLLWQLIVFLGIIPTPDTLEKPWTASCIL